MSAVDLTTLEHVRLHLQRGDPTHTEQDEVISGLITAYSRLIVSVYREFAPAIDGEARTLELVDPQDGLHSLAPYDCRGAASVVIDQGKSTERALNADEWTLAQYDAANGVWQAIEIPCLRPGVFQRGHTITITGDWGFEQVPEDAELACRLAVVMALRSDVQAFGTAFQPNSFGEGLNDEQALPPGVRGLLRRFRRSGVA